MKRSALLVLALGSWITSTDALANVEVGGTAGLHTFSSDDKLGDSPEKDTLKDTALFGGRLGVFFNKMFGVEVEVGYIESEPKDILFNVYNITYRGSIVAVFGDKKPDTKLLPFVLAGAGVVQTVRSDNEERFGLGSVVVPHVGVGAKYRTNGGWGVRGDLRLQLPPKFESGITEEIELLFSLYREFGHKTVAKKEAPPPPKDDDPDHDGIKGAADKCPNEPEDKDGFQDDDGCPDLDNDGDGIPDKDDKCPDKPETRNGFEDDDGCPDEIPEKLKSFTGVIQGITFKPGSVELAGDSTKVLDKAIAVMAEFKGVKLEIQGHTDDQPLKAGGKFTDNIALSQGRAESVKAYFVKKGIEDSRLVAKGYGDTAPVEDPKGLTGNKLDAARNKNRRVEFKLIANEPTAVPSTTPPPANP